MAKGEGHIRNVAGRTVQRGNVLREENAEYGNAFQASILIEKAFDEFDEKGFITTRPILVGIVENEVVIHSLNIGKPLKDKSIYFKNDELEHSQRDTKVNADIAVDREDFKNFPFTKSSMAIYYDKETERYTYTDYKNKFILEPNVKVRLGNGKTKAVTLITATKMKATDEFNMDKYTKIK